MVVPHQHPATERCVTVDSEAAVIRQGGAAVGCNLLQRPAQRAHPVLLPQRRLHPLYV